MKTSRNLSPWITMTLMLAATAPGAETVPLSLGGPDLDPDPRGPVPPPTSPTLSAPSAFSAPRFSARYDNGARAVARVDKQRERAKRAKKKQAQASRRRNRSAR